jgi:PTS system nitrogen regulatory IIA component
MDLTSYQVETLLNVSPSDLELFIQDKNLPFYTLEGEKRFNLLEIESWLFTHRFWEGCHKLLPFNLYRALARGGFLHVDDLGDASILKLGAYLLGKHIGIDEDGIFSLLQAREQLASTAIGSGYALPHPRERIEGLTHDVCFIIHLKNPIEFGSVDQTKVHTFFFLLSGSDKGHLNLLSKIAHMVHDEKCRALFSESQTHENLLQAVLEWEKKLT